MKGLYTHTGHKLSSFTHMHKCKMVNMHIDVSSNTQIIKKKYYELKALGETVMELSEVCAGTPLKTTTIWVK